jgi:hypothetical protein
VAVAEATGYWIPNGGQWPEEILFASAGPGCGSEVWVDREGFCMRDTTQAGLEATARWTFAEVFIVIGGLDESFTGTELAGVESMGHRHSFFMGSNPERWAGGLPAFAALEIAGRIRVLPANGGIWVGEPSAGFRYLRLTDADLTVTQEGSIGSSAEHLAEVDRPSLDGKGEEITPKLIVPFSQGEWSTFFGAACMFNTEHAWDACITQDGDLILLLSSACIKFYSPTINDLSAPGLSTSGMNPDLDYLLGRFDGVSGRLEWITRLGGSNDDGGAHLIATPDGRIAIAGHTHSKDFPLTDGAIDNSFPPPLLQKGFVLLLSGSGDALQYSSYLGLASNFAPFAIAVDPSGRLAVGGTSSTQFSPGLEAWTSPDWPDQLTPESSTEAGLVVFRLDTMAIDYAGLLGGSSTELIHAMTFDATGALTVVGLTGSTKQSFPKTPGTYTVPVQGSGPKLFATRIAPDGKSFEYSAWIGQSSQAEIEVAVLPDRSTVIAGRTLGSTLPTTPGVIDPTPDFDDAFLMQLKPDAKGLVWCTYLGSPSAYEPISALEVDSSGMLTVVARNSGFPPVKQYGPGLSVSNVAARITPGATKVLYAVALTEASSSVHPVGGGSLPGSRIGMGGTAYTSLFPVSPDAFDTTYSGIYDGYVAALSLLPNGVRHLEGSGSTCSAGLTLGATRPAWPGESEFAIYLSGGPPAGLGVLVIGAQSAVPLEVAGTLSWIDPASAPALLPLALGPLGFLELPLPIPLGASGAELAIQAFLLPPTGCSGPLLSSHGLAIRML